MRQPMEKFGITVILQLKEIIGNSTWKWVWGNVTETDEEQNMTWVTSFAKRKLDTVFTIREPGNYSFCKT